MEVIDLIAERKKFGKMSSFRPYPKQELFFTLGATKNERMLTAGNQLGKTTAGAVEAASHATGVYPEWWKGKRFDHRNDGWVCGVTSTAVRDGPQTLLFGPPSSESQFGTGFIPKSSIIGKPTTAHGATGLYDTASIKHINGGVSTIQFKSYEQGREKFQGLTRHWIWDDEEPPMDIYTEQLARLTATRGIIYVTFTSMNGATDLVVRFTEETATDREIVTIGLVDAKHISPEDYPRIINQYPVHEREARVYGGIMRGEGRIFVTPEDQLYFDLERERIPPYWTKLWGIDFGIAHPFAAVLVCWDKDNDVLYITDAMRFKATDTMRNLPLLHAAAMKPIGINIPVAWPQDGTARESGGLPLAKQYKMAGLKMLDKHATFPDGSISTEAGIQEMRERFETGRLKVARHLGDWFEEYRNYHREKGLVVKERDDLMSATRIAVMAKRFARVVPFGGVKNSGRKMPTIPEDPPWGW